MSSEKEIVVEDMFGLEKGKCDSDHIGLQDDSETDSSEIRELKEIEGKEKYRKKNTQFKVVLDDLSELSFVVKNRIAYINHCIDDIIDLSKDNYLERYKKASTAIKKLGRDSWRVEIRLKKEISRLCSMNYHLKPINLRKETYIDGVGKINYVNNNKIPDELEVKFVKKSDEFSANFMFKWLNKEPEENVYEKYEKVEERIFLLNKLKKIIKNIRSGFTKKVFGINYKK